MFDGVFLWLLIGLAVGVLGRLATPRHDPGGIVATILLGIAGALLAFYLVPLLGAEVRGGWQALAGATAGAVALLVCYRLVLARRV